MASYTAPTDKVTGGTLTADEFNDLADAAEQLDGALYSIEAFGAVRASTSIRTALNDAIAAATAAGRGTVFIPQGSWNLDDNSRTVTDGAMTSADKTLTSATAAFTSADVGRAVEVTGAGVAGAVLHSFIFSVTDATSVELVDPAGTTVAAASTVIVDRVSIPANVNLVGAGGRATQITLTTARAGIDFGDGATGGSRRGRSGGFMVNPGGAALRPVKLLLGANWNLDDIRIPSLTANGTGLTITMTQNVGVNGIEVQGNSAAGTTGIEFDRGCKNITIRQGTVNDCATNVRFRQSGLHAANATNTHPERIVINDILSESTVAGSPLHISAGEEIYWVGGAVNALAGNTAVKIELDDEASVGAATRGVTIDSAQIQAPSSAGTAIAVSVASNTAVYLKGPLNIKATDTVLSVSGSSARIHMDSAVSINQATTTTFITPPAGRTAEQILTFGGARALVTGSNQSKTTAARSTDLTAHNMDRLTEWIVDGVILYDASTDASQGMTLAWSLPTSATINWEVLAHNLSDALAWQRGTEATTISVGGAGTGTTLVARISGRLKISSTSGDVELHFGSTDANAARFLAGSRLTLTQVK